jgi:two-component system, NtrC family, nitrogen regulation sensor histidine kinase NtrY
VLLRLKKYIFLLAAALALVLAGLFFLLDKGEAGQTDYTVLVQERLQTELQQARQDMEMVLSRVPLPQGKPFSNLLTDTQYPLYLYRNSTLLVWSDHRYSPEDSNLLASVSETRTLETPAGKFLVLTKEKLVDTSRYTAVAMVRLFTQSEEDGDDPSSGYNPNLFPVAPRSLHLEANEGIQVQAEGDRVYFYVDPPSESVYRGYLTPLVSLALLLLAILFLGVHFGRWLNDSQLRHRYGYVLALLVTVLLLLRGVMLYFSIPFSFIKGKVFNPEYYSASVLTPSLGDLLLNCLALGLVLIYVNSIYFRTITYRMLIRSGREFQWLFSFLILLVSYVGYYIAYRELIGIYENSSYGIDITLSIRFDSLKITSLLIFISLSGLYFLVVNLIVNVFIRLIPDWRWGVGMLLASVVVAALVAWLVRIEFEWIYLIHIAYILVLYLTQLPRTFYGFRYPTIVYYFVGALVSAFLATYVVETQEIKKDVFLKKEFGRHLLTENDLLAEHLLSKSSDLIAVDSDIKAVFAENTPFGRELIQQRIKNNFLDPYLSQYDTEVMSFDPGGNSLDNSALAKKYSYYVDTYAKPEFETTQPALYLVNSSAGDNLKQYLSFVKMQGDKSTAGYIIINLRQRALAPPNRYSDLLLDAQVGSEAEARKYSYAIFEKGKLLYSSGTHNYDLKFPVGALQNHKLYENGLTLSDCRHVGQVGTHDRIVVVSSKAWEWKNLLADFSFLYLILVVVVSLAIFGHALRYSLSSLPLTYSTKIQILLNAAFTLPLLIVLFFILRVIGSNYKENQQNTYLDNSRNMAANVLGYLEDYRKGNMSQAYFEQQVRQIARDADLDLDLFDTTGRLVLSSRPIVYRNRLAGKLLNPAAQKQIVEQKESQLLLNESVGSLHYTTAYAALKSYDQKLLGVLRIPYTDSEPRLNRQILDIVASVLIVFTAMLLIFLIASYVAANMLLVPLRALTRKLSTTSLNQPNEPLDWQSNDEIGALIKKYNQMLINLEANKQALSTNEKQSAWREMAKQVAHEIKNPLTPMKLTLQQLQRTLRRDDPGALEKVSRAMESVIEQIDNIGYIAQSFSDIARMPPPQSEVFEITSVINKAYELYASDKNMMFRREIEKGPLYVSGDRQQFGASITNLIINAKQSVPDTRPIELLLKLYTHKDNVMIEIRDNGSGIPQNIRSRVFLPNFTTRQGGTGLGLAMAKRIIEHARGSIWFETEEEKGTTFFISLPLVKG